MGFGSTVASQAQTKDPIWNPKMDTSVENCPYAFFNSTVPEAKPKFEPFLHLELYEVSYMFFYNMFIISQHIIQRSPTCTSPRWPASGA